MAGKDKIMKILAIDKYEEPVVKEIEKISRRILVTSVVS